MATFVKRPKLRRVAKAKQPADERYLVIDGRRWRRTDPQIPETLRAELVGELMAARRAVKAAMSREDEAALRLARARVQDAKLALGERGAAWWESASRHQQEQRASATMRALLRRRGPKKTICPSDVARVLAGDDFRASLQLVRDVSAALTKAGELEVRQKGKAVDPEAARGPIRLALPNR